MRSLFLLIFCPFAVVAQSPCPIPDIVLRSDDTGKAEATLAFPTPPPPNLTMAEFEPKLLKDAGIAMDNRSQARSAGLCQQGKAHGNQPDPARDLYDFNQGR